MKLKFTFSIIFFIIICGINGQTPYVKMLKEDTTTWQHWGMYFSPRSSETSNIFDSPTYNSIAAIDTITINNKLYRKLYHLSQPAFINYSNKQLIGYLREDTLNKKLFFRPSLLIGDYPLYDFNLNVGDSTQLFFAFTQLSGYYKVDSIIVKNELAGNRKHFYLRKHLGNTNPNVNYVEYIEGIGSTYHLLYINGSFAPGMFPSTTQCKQPWMYGLSCKHDDNIKQYSSCAYIAYQFWMNNNGDCNYYSIAEKLNTNSLDYYIKIGPNPSNEKIEVQIERSFETINCNITDMAGKTLLMLSKESLNTANNSFIISTKDLDPGIYILQVKLNETIIKRPIIIQN